MTEIRQLRAWLADARLRLADPPERRKEVAARSPPRRAWR